MGEQVSPATRWANVRGSAAFGLAMGALVGVAELAILGFDRYVKGSIIRFGLQTVWMKPLAEAVVFGLLATLIDLAWRRRRVSGRALWTLVIALGVYSALGSYHRQLYPAAEILLAIGLGWRLAAFGRFPWDALRGRVVRIGLALVALALAVAIVLSQVPWWLAARHAASAAGPDRPNVVLIVFDTVRARNLSVYGYGRPTSPELERLAREGIRFDWAIAPAPWTTPSHATLFTGELPDRACPGWKTPCDPDLPRIAGFLAQRGYRTAGLTGNTSMATAEFNLNIGFDLYLDKPMTVSEFARNSVLAAAISEVPILRRPVGLWEVLGRHQTADLVDRGLRWLDQGDGRPFFLFFNFFDAHAPYLPPEPYRARFARTPARPNPWMTRLSKPGGTRYEKSEVPAELDAYDGAIAYVDAMVGKVRQELEKRHLTKRTIVIVTADHGEEFGERGRVGHLRGLNTSLLHVPLVMAWPGKLPAGETIKTPVGLVDLPRTIAQLTGFGAESPFRGRLLDTIPAGDASLAAPVPVFSELEAARSVVFGRWHFARFEDGRRELYDILADPFERQNVIDTAEGRAVVPQLEQLVKAGTR